MNKINKSDELDEIIQCPICEEFYGSIDIHQHVSECIGHEFYDLDEFATIAALNEINALDEFDGMDYLNNMNEYVEPILTEKQKKAIKYCNSKAKIHSEQTEGMVKIKLIENRYDDSDADKIYNYISKVKITINIKIETVLKFVINDKKLKNLFETSNKNNIGGRTNWLNTAKYLFNIFSHLFLFFNFFHIFFFHSFLPQIHSLFVTCISPSLFRVLFLFFHSSQLFFHLNIFYYMFYQIIF